MERQESTKEILKLKQKSLLIYKLLIRSYLKILKIDKFKISQKKIKLWSKKMSTFFNNIKWSILDYTEILLTLANIHIIFQENDKAMSMVDNVLLLLTNTSKNKILTLYIKKDKNLFEYYIKKGYYFKALIDVNCDRIDSAIDNILKAFNFGSIFKLKLRIKLFKILKDLLIKKNSYAISPLFDQFIAFYEGTKPNNYVVIIDGSDRISGHSNNVTMICKNIVSRFKKDDKLNLYAYNSCLTASCIIEGKNYKSQSDMKTSLHSEITHFMKKVRDKSNNSQRDVYNVLETILRSLHYKKYNVYFFLFVLGPLKSKMQQTNSHETDLNFKIQASCLNLKSFSTEFAERFLINFMLLCNNKEELKEEKILQFMHTNKRNHILQLDDYKKEESKGRIAEILKDFIF